jgi:RimJ/RimL family protein N-acetyltransferase
LENKGFTLKFNGMHLNDTMTQAKQLIAATLEAPAEFWRGHAHVREKAPASEAGVNPQAYPESDEKGLKVAGLEASVEPSIVPIRSLNSRHRRRIAAHIVALPEHDRYLRFGYVATDEQVQKYVDGLDFKRDEIYGIFNRRLQLIAMAHLALTTDPKCSSCAEFGVSVSAEARGKGLGTRLFDRAILHARAEHVDMIFIHALSENTAMLKIARKVGAVVENYGGEVEAHLRLPAQDFADRMETAVKDAIEDGLGEVDFRIKLRALQFWELLASLQDMRKGIISARQDSAP